MKFFDGSERRINKDKSGENIPQLEINEVK